MSLTSTGFHPSAPVLNAIDRTFPVTPKGWGITHWDCDLIWDDEFKTSTARIKRHSDVNSYDTLKMEREGLEVEVILQKPDAGRDELEAALIRACTDIALDQWLKNPYLGRDNDDYYPGFHFTVVCR